MNKYRENINNNIYKKTVFKPENCNYSIDFSDRIFIKNQNLDFPSNDFKVGINTKFNKNVNSSIDMTRYYLDDNNYRNYNNFIENISRTGIDTRKMNIKCNN